MNQPWPAIAAAISRASGARFRPTAMEPVAGGCINAAVRLGDGKQYYFVKTNTSDSADMFEAEQAGLRALRVPGAPRLPAPVVTGTTHGVAYLVLEHLPLARLSPSAWACLGTQLAALHRTTESGFGWHRNNTIGATPQINDWTADWVEFWRGRRLAPQLALAEDNGLAPRVVARGRELAADLESLFADHAPKPSLLHGDLWRGNVAADAAGDPVLFDPAVYYGDRETDLAMSELFGRFDPVFYEAYEAAWPLAPGYPRRRDLYNLYHVLNHFNLFGGGYAGEAGAMIETLLSGS